MGQNHRLSVAEAASCLGVSVGRVHQRIRDGSLTAERVGQQWVLSTSDLHELVDLPRGRPVSRRSAWTIVAESLVRAPDTSDGDAVAWATAWLGQRQPTERRRARVRLSQLLEISDIVDDAVAGIVAARLRHSLHNRAARQRLRASPLDLDDVRRDRRCHPAGLSDPRAGMAAGDVAEVYVRSTDYDGVVRDYLLQEDRDGNVILRTLDDTDDGPSPWSALGSPLLLAADLADQREPRASHRAVELLRPLSSGTEQ